jgi:type III secretion protein R
MAPVGSAISERLEPSLSGKIADPAELAMSTVNAIREPIQKFLGDNASQRELDRFFELAKNARSADQREAVTRGDFSVVLPAFLVSELVAAFLLGFAIFLPFLVVDLVVANVLVALGLSQLNAIQVSLPFKLLLFVAADGWGLLSETLVSGYRFG